jgi:hypothetical protein
MTHYWAEVNHFYIAFSSNMMRRKIFINTGMGLTGWKKITTDYGKYMECLKLHTGHFVNFTTLSLNLATDKVIVWLTSTIST